MQVRNITVGASVNDVVIDNGSGAAVRGDINDVIMAIVTSFSGTTAPLTTYPFQLWANTADGYLYQRSGDNSMWLKKDVLDSEYTPFDSSGFVKTDSTTQSIAGKKTFTSALLAPTVTAGTNDTNVATTAFVKNAIDTAISNIDISSQLTAYMKTADANAKFATISNPRFTGTAQCSGDFQSNVSMSAPLVRSYVAGSGAPQWPTDEEEAITADTLQKQVESLERVIEGMARTLQIVQKKLSVKNQPIEIDVTI